MKRSRIQPVGLLVLILIASFASLADAVPFTGGRGPGGVETTASVGSALNLWLKADSLTGYLPNAPVGSWANSATHGTAASAATQGNVNQQPLYQSSVAGLNGNPALNFDGLASNTLGDMLTTTNVLLPNTAAMYVVAQEAVQNIDNGSCCRPLFANGSGIDGGGPGYSLALRDSDASPNTNLFILTPGAVDQPAGIVTQNGEHHFYLLNRNGSATNGTVTYRDNVQVFQATRTGNVTDTTYNIGADPQSAARHYAGNMAEVIFFSRTLTDVERRLVDNYISAKYNLGPTVSGANRTLGSSDLYQGDLDTFGNYDRDVFGVGRSSTAQVINSGNAGFGIEVVSGVSAGELGVGDWILAGHAVMTNNIIAAQADGGYQGQRWERAWYVDVTDTGAVGVNAVLGFDFDDAGLSGQFDINDSFQLLFSETSALDWEVMTLSAVVDPSGLVTFSLPGDLMLDGYYTLGINMMIPAPEPGTGLLLLAGLVGLRRRKRG